MDRLISEQAVLEVINNAILLGRFDCGKERTIEEIKAIPSAEPQWIPIERLPKHYDSHDLIHRETARRIIDSPRTKEQMLMVLASAENQKKTGHWIRFKEFENGYYHIKCSECGQYWSIDGHAKTFKYCFNCGARMESEQNG